MNAKEYLKQIEIINFKIGQKQERIESLRDSLSVKGVSYDYRVPNESNNNNSLSNMMIEIISLEIEMQNEIIALQKKSIEISNNICILMSDIRYMKVLYYRYVMCLSWNQIAKKMVYDINYVHRIHRQALNEFDKMIQKDTFTNDIMILSEKESD